MSYSLPGGLVEQNIEEEKHRYLLNRNENFDTFEELEAMVEKAKSQRPWLPNDASY